MNFSTLSNDGCGVYRSTMVKKDEMGGDVKNKQKYYKLHLAMAIRENPIWPWLDERNVSIIEGIVCAIFVVANSVEAIIRKAIFFIGSVIIMSPTCWD
jgi:hypothetical protein